jgi:hypothetical protein
MLDPMITFFRASHRANLKPQLLQHAPQLEVWLGAVNGVYAPV